ncbi:MAG: hypothetical protein IKT71_07945 [Paludibacteraceae bacterium]|nr:hypothetical protein [Paludibacteraceae bacterium]MEE0921829.1 hypothetical protein [Paludibacteraceae bacterium]
MTRFTINIAKKHAAKTGMDVVRPCVKVRGWSYYHLNYSVRPRYLGLPIIIKISKKGKIVRVLDMEERFWAYKLAKEAL